MDRLSLFVILVAVVVLVFVIEVVRRRRLSEGYALLWIAVGIGGVILGLLRPLIDRFSDEIGVSYGANVVFASVFLFLLIVAINLSMHVSKLEDQMAALAEEIAIIHGPQTGPDPARSPAPATPDDDHEPVAEGPNS